MRHERTKARPAATTQKGDRQFQRYDIAAPGLTILNLPSGSVPMSVQRFGSSLNVYVIEPIATGALVPHRFHAFPLLQAIEIPPHFRYLGAGGSVVGNDYFHCFWEPDENAT